MCEDPQTALAGDVEKGMAVLDHMQVMQQLPDQKQKKPLGSFRVLPRDVGLEIEWNTGVTAGRPAPR